VNYYVARNGQQFGPYTEETVRSYVAAGSLLAADNIRAETSQSWTTISQLFQIPQTAPALMAQPQMAPQYAQAPHYAQVPQYGQVVPGAQIVPPNLHWALLLLLCITWIFPVIWAFIQAGFARKIDQSSNAMWGFVLWLILSGTDLAMNISAVMAGGQASTSELAGLLGLGGVVCYYWGVYGIRKSMVTYYNSVEPIQLQLSGVMTFFFGILYLQYHMSRIARWKKTGVLTT
jgi:hypothetical protein